MGQTRLILSFIFQIPLDFIKIINEHNVSDLLRNYIEYDNEEPPFVASKLNLGHFCFLACWTIYLIIYIYP